MFDIKRYDEKVLNTYLPDNDMMFYIEKIAPFKNGNVEELRDTILHHMVDNKTSCDSVEYELFIQIIKDIDGGIKSESI